MDYYWLRTGLEAAAVGCYDGTTTRFLGEVNAICRCLGIVIDMDNRRLFMMLFMVMMAAAMVITMAFTMIPPFFLGLFGLFSSSLEAVASGDEGRLIFTVMLFFGSDFT